MHLPGVSDRDPGFTRTRSHALARTQPQFRDAGRDVQPRLTFYADGLKADTCAGPADQTIGAKPDTDCHTGRYTNRLNC